MIITITGPGRRKSLFFWITASALALLLINLFLYFTLYNDSTGLESTSDLVPDQNSKDSSSTGSSGVKAIFESANDFISSVTGSDDETSTESSLYELKSNNKRNTRLKSYLPLSYYESEGFEDLKETDPRIQEFDRRLLPAFYFHLINKNLLNDEDKFLPENFKLPFNWDLLNDYAVKIQKMKYFDRVIKGKMNCEQFKNMAPKNIPETFLKNYCVNYNFEDPNFTNDYNVPFLVLRKIDQYLSDVEWRRLYGMMYTLTSSPIPENVMFLGSIAKESKSLLVPLQKVSNGKNNLAALAERPLTSYYTKLTDDYIEEQSARFSSANRNDILRNGISVYDEWLRFNQQMSNKVLDTEVDLNYMPDKPVIIGHSGETKLEPLELSIEDFKFYLPDEEAKLLKLIKKAPEGANTKQLEHLDMWAKQVLDPKFEEPWYYGIPSIETEHLDHYDWRFFSVWTLKEDPELHTAVLHRLSRVWFRICAEFKVPSWMNHGPLIGWYWSGVTLPYDFDLDLQMPIQSLHRISKFLNNTLVYDFTQEDEYINDDIKIDNRAELGIRSYLIDIDPLYFDRNQVRSIHNDLDARLIDTETGIYIDLTAVSEFHSGARYDLDEELRYFKKSDYLGFRITVPSHFDRFKNAEGVYVKDQVKGCVMKDEYVKQVEKFMKESNTKDPRVEGSPTHFLDNYVHDKHFHTYKFEELSPLIPTYYENSISYIPSNWYKNTVIEYSGARCLSNSYFQNYKFLSKLMLWVGYDDCPIWDKASGDFKDGMTENMVSNQCISDHDKLDMQYKRSIHYTTKHNIYREKLLKGQGDILKFEDFETTVTPMLEQFDGRLIIPEPYVERKLY